jgi:DNA-binding transcriptional LysR family regulator
MELRQLRYFHSVATLGGFRRAADSLLIAQPAVSQQIQRLELELGVTLFDREQRPVALTPAGEYLLGHAERMLVDAATVEADMRRYSTHGENSVAIGAMQYLTLLELPDLLVRFRKSHPGHAVTLTVGNTGELEALLRKRHIELAIAHVDQRHIPSRLVAEPLREEELVLIVHADHALSAAQRVDIRDLANAPFIVSRVGGRIRETFAEAAQSSGFTPRIAFETADLGTAVKLVSRNLGVAVIPRATIVLGGSSVVPIRLGPAAPVLTVSLLHLAKRRRSPGARALSAFFATAF